MEEKPLLKFLALLFINHQNTTIIPTKGWCFFVLFQLSVVKCCDSVFALFFG